jgi:tol-pal system protein YbgF
MRKLLLFSFVLGLVTSAYADVPVLEESSSFSNDHSATQVAAAPQPRSVPTLSKSAETAPPAQMPVVLTTEQRIAKLENQVSNIKQAETQKRIDDLQEKVEKLSGQVENQAHQIDQLNSEIKSFYEDLSKRIAKLKNVASGDVDVTTDEIINNNGSKQDLRNQKTKPALTGKNKPVVADASDKKIIKDKDQDPGAVTKPITDKQDLTTQDQETYQEAFDYLQHKDYAQATTKLRAYVTSFPAGIYVANAHYWLGEVQFLQDKLTLAAEEFQVVLTKFPHSTKVPDAMLKLALIHDNQGKHDLAKKELANLVKKYPRSAAAHLASQQLQMMKD